MTGIYVLNTTNIQTIHGVSLNIDLAIKSQSGLVQNLISYWLVVSTSKLDEFHFTLS